MDEEPWWSPERIRRLPAPERAKAMSRLTEAVDHHLTVRTTTDDLARLRSKRWLRAHGLTALVE
ncbi:hypothetical protein SAMN05192558_11639 [Actinokineospora alba]|uniref:Uncharacterized protein n=1 Tax=Actinokineospora alba TaxID=504798 RepID=A0A1H0VY90_9PSEU|nr:hypothetical protein [Actinokineospora alba]TDP67117.1 hypothetical protein C8E96_2636 [Actinokineospora alba]SDJ46451.1 hypothetical protein SAMN05421871_11640 [Actinokineospora alba]SDP83185.1 hypothetical protein SAMN05192558_11639 [Actinokineospora alba]